MSVKVLKSTGVTRKIDELGRIVVPKEIRKNLGIREGESLEIYTSDDAIVLKKHYEIWQNHENIKRIINIAEDMLNLEVLVTDREKIILGSCKNTKLSVELLSYIDNRQMYFGYVESLGDIYTLVPIISESSALGLIMIKENVDNSKIGKFLARLIADKIDIT